MEACFLATTSVVVLAALIEIILAMSWNRFYFSFGIPVFYHEIPVSRPRAEPPEAMLLEGLLENSARVPLEFRQMEQDRLVFREVIRFGSSAWRWRWHWGPVMHGVLHFDLPGRRVRVIGLVNWSVLAFAVLVIVALLSQPLFWLFSLFFLLIVGVCYVVQGKQFQNVARVAAKKWNIW